MLEVSQDVVCMESLSRFLSLSSSSEHKTTILVFHEAGLGERIKIGQVVGKD